MNWQWENPKTIIYNRRSNCYRTRKTTTIRRWGTGIFQQTFICMLYWSNEGWAYDQCCLARLYYNLLCVLNVYIRKCSVWGPSIASSLPNYVSFIVLGMSLVCIIFGFAHNIAQYIPFLVQQRCWKLRCFE